VMSLDTNQASRFAPACGRFDTAIAEGSLSHDGKPGLRAHLAACARKKVRLMDDDDDGRTKFVIVKADTRKIDRAVAAVLAHEAAMTMPDVAAAVVPMVAWR
jgi:phage terminase large subunit-like protein